MQKIGIIMCLLLFGILLFGCTTTQTNQTPTNNSNPNVNPNTTENQTYTPSYQVYFYAPDTLPDAVVGQPYNYSFCDPTPTNVNDLCGALEDATNPSGGHYPYHFTLDSGTGFQPFGLKVNLNGLLAGTPTAAGTKTFSVCAVDLDGNQACSNVTLTVDPARSVAIHFIGTGTGRVNVSNGYGEEAQVLNCSSDCTLSFVNGTTIFLDAAADNSSALMDWSGDCNGSYKSCDFTMDSDKQVTVDFEKYSVSFTSATCTYAPSYNDYAYKVKVSGTATGPQTTSISLDNGLGSFLDYAGNCGSWNGSGSSAYGADQGIIFGCRNDGAYGSTQWTWTYSVPNPNDNANGDSPWTDPIAISISVGYNTPQKVPYDMHCN